MVLIGVALCVMTALGIVAASAMTQRSPSLLAESDLAVSPSLAPGIPQAEAVAPAASGSSVSQQWVNQVSAKTGIGAIALQAYGAATLRLGKEQPGCRLGWTTLAGIGGIESGHGTENFASLLPDGRTSQLILGPALNGKDGFAAIRSTAETAAWHGDATWDHAVGPMQFIPSTWETWQSDGNDDGVKDPSNVFDAAYAAGRYLCASGANLTTDEGWTRAVFSYNHSDDYVRSVLAFANSYASR